MDWTSIILGVIGFIGGGFSTILLLPQTKKSSEVAVLTKVIDQLQEVNTDLLKEISDKRAYIKELQIAVNASHKDKLDLSTELAKYKTLFCEKSLSCIDKIPPIIKR